MDPIKVAALIFSVLLITTSFASIPLLKAETPSTNQQISTNINQQTLAYYVVGVTSNRIPLKLIPLPSVSMNHGVKIGSNEADIIVMAIPATQKSKNFDSLKFISGLLTKVVARQESLSGQLIAELYNSLYNQVIEMGAKQAFLPYENLTFTFVVIIWIKSKSLGEFIASIGAGALKSVSDSLILVSFSLTENALQEIRSGISEKINEIANKLLEQINNYLTNIENELLNYLNNKIDNLNCIETCSKIEETYQTVCTYTLPSIQIQPIITATFNKGKISIKINVVDNMNKVYESNDIAFVSKDFFVINAENIINSQSYDKDLIDDGEVNSLIQVLGGYIYDSILSFKAEKTILPLKSFTIDAGGSFDSCGTAKENMKAIAKVVAGNVISYINEKVDESIKSITDQLNQFTVNVFNELSITLNKIRVNLQYAASEAVNYAAEFLETTVYTAVSQLVTKTNPAVFAVYTIAEGISQALQTCVDKISVTVEQLPSDDIDQSILVVHEEQVNKRVVRLPEPNDKITAEQSVSLGEKILSAAKGFAAGVLGAIFGPAARKAINVIPSVFVVNMQLKSGNKWLIAPSWPGIYAINLAITPHTYAEWLSKLPSSLTSIFFKDIDKNKNSLVEKLMQKFKVSIKNVRLDDKEFGAKMIVPYLVLPPYFIVESVRIENSIVSMNFTAIYDFSALIRVSIRNQINELRKIVSKGTEVIDKLYGIVKNTIKDLVNRIFDIVLNYLNSKLTSEYIKKFINDLYNYLIEYIFNTIIDPILEQLFEKFIKKQAIKFVEFIDKILTIAEQQLEYFDRFIALTLSVIRIDIVNSDVNVALAVPSLGYVSSRSIDQFGKVKVRFSQSALYRFLGNCIGAIPLYMTAGPDGKVSYFIAPWATYSLEPLVTPLIPVVRVMNDKLNLVFLTPFNNRIVDVRYTFVVDGASVQEVPMSTLRKAAIIGVKINSVRIDDTRGVGAVLPLPVEFPVAVNPSVLVGES